MREPRETLELIHQGMVHAGIDTDAIYRRVADSGFLLLGKERFDHRVHAALWRALEEETGDSEIGLHLCPHLPILRSKAFEYLFLSSRNYAEGLRAAFEYQRLISDTLQARLEQDEQGPCVILETAACEAPELRHSEICTAYVFLQSMAEVTAERFKPEAIRFHYTACAASSEYEVLFGCPVSFNGPQTELRLSPSLLAHRSPHSDPDFHALHKKHADHQLARIARHDFVRDVADYLRSRFMAGHYMRGNEPNLAEVASEFGVAGRHLRYMLNEAGTNFRHTLQAARMSCAVRLVERTDRHVDDIASVLGFSQTSAFHRAFKSWTGITAQEYRRGLRPKITSPGRKRGSDDDHA